MCPMRSTRLLGRPARGLVDSDFKECFCAPAPETDHACPANRSAKDDWRWPSWANFYSNMAEPSAAQKVFRAPYCGQKLGIAYLEARGVASLQGTLYNVAHVYGGSDAALYIVHSAGNAETVKRVTAGWQNVQYMDAMTPFRSVSDYNRYMVSWAFNNAFPQQFVLVTQADVVLTRRIPEHFFRFAYVGAPWAHWANAVGNGGFSLRRMETMRRLLSANGENPQAEPEDLWYSFRLHDWEVPEPGCASSFSVENIWCDTAVAIHQIEAFAPNPCRMAAYLCRVPGYTGCKQLKARLGVA